MDAETVPLEPSYSQTLTISDSCVITAASLRTGLTRGMTNCVQTSVSFFARARGGNVATDVLVVLVHHLRGDDRAVLQQSLVRTREGAALQQTEKAIAYRQLDVPFSEENNPWVRTCTPTMNMMKNMRIQFAPVVAIHSSACTGE